ncbi:response regulator [Cytophagaceae bacterium DM2B3-1]|uniref:Response regulator n=1 Tax=Xanthocytophaga flava TaxID=3048013 RepID=A0ABT7CRC7_9BACT|nr:response regulator [Xanthocytophaga flavus]MDJ1496306.1 response regulator [Xanthocytophaga flavus]
MSINIGKRFLIVDDDSDDRELFREALTAVEPEVVLYSAANGQTAIEKLASQAIDQPDIIFLDLNMPVMNGWDCLNQLKSLQEYKNIPVIIHTTSSHTQDKKLAKERGAICLFTKPDDFKRLKAILEIVVEKMNKKAVDSICEAVYKYLQLI